MIFGLGTVGLSVSIERYITVDASVLMDYDVGLNLL